MIYQSYTANSMVVNILATQGDIRCNGIALFYAEHSYYNHIQLKEKQLHVVECVIFTLSNLADQKIKSGPW